MENTLKHFENKMAIRELIAENKRDFKDFLIETSLENFYLAYSICDVSYSVWYLTLYLLDYFIILFCYFFLLELLLSDLS